MGLSRPFAVLCALAMITSGCRAGRNNLASTLTQAPELTTSTGQTKCGVRASTNKPLVVEWPAADRAALEARANRGLIAVRYEGCEMEVLTNCTATGQYGYMPLTPKREAVHINNADELYANLPVGAAKLEAKLERDGQLNVDMLIIGRKEAESSSFTERDLQGRCQEATHVVTGLTVGAFSFYTGAAAEIGAGASIGNIGAGASSAHRREILNQDGREEACATAATDTTTPPGGCGALLRVEVVPIDRIFGGTTVAPVVGGTAASPASATSTPAQTFVPRYAAPHTTSNPSASTVTADADLERRRRTWRWVMVAGYGLTVASLGMVYGGAYMMNKAKTAVGTTAPGAERQKQIQRYKTGLGLSGGGVAGAAVFATVAIIANAKAASLKSSRQRAQVLPTFMAGGGGLAVDLAF